MPSPKRKRVVGALAKVAPTVPTAYVESPVQTVLGAAHRIVETELAFMERKQKVPNAAPMTPAEAKKFANLIGAFERSIAIGQALEDRELKDLSNEDLDRKLVEALEAERRIAK